MLLLTREIDWYWTRAAKGGTAVPYAIATYATALYSEHETKKTAIAACNTLQRLLITKQEHILKLEKILYDGDGILMARIKHNSVARD